MMLCIFGLYAAMGTDAPIEVLDFTTLFIILNFIFSTCDSRQIGIADWS